MKSASVVLRQLTAYGGLAARMPWMVTFYVITALALVGLPILNGFVGEFLVLSSTFATHLAWGAVATLGAIFSAAAVIIAYAARPSLNLEMDRSLPRRLASGFYDTERSGQSTFAWTSQRADIKLAGLSLWVHWRQFEAARDYWDGNWLRVTAHLRAPGARVWTTGSIIHLAELERWLSTVTADQLSAPAPVPAGPGWPPYARGKSVLQCVQVVLNEEWAHHGFCVRDLDLLGS